MLLITMKASARRRSGVNNKNSEIYEFAGTGPRTGSRRTMGPKSAMFADFRFGKNSEKLEEGLAEAGPATDGSSLPQRPPAPR
jgi:hypothetical protein